MTITVKLDPLLEEQLRLRAAGSACTASDVIRAALVAYLEQPEAAPARSAYALGQDLFERHAGDPELAGNRKQQIADAWADKHRARSR